jgi:hypothetical protein
VSHANATQSNWASQFRIRASLIHTGLGYVLHTNVWLFAIASALDSILLKSMKWRRAQMLDLDALPGQGGELLFGRRAPEAAFDNGHGLRG